MEFSLENLCLDIGTQRTNREGFRLYFSSLIKIVTKISSCQVNTTSRWGIKQLGIISFGSIFLLFSTERSGQPHS